MKARNKAKNNLKKGSALIYVLLLLTLTFALGTSAVMMAHSSGNETFKEINYQQSYYATQTGLDLILAQFENKDNESALRDIATTTALNQTQNITISNLPTKIGSVNGTMTCTVFNTDYNACSEFEISVTGAYRDKSRTLKAKIKGIFIPEMAISTPLNAIDFVDTDFDNLETNKNVIVTDENGTPVTDNEDIITKLDELVTGSIDGNHLASNAYNRFATVVEELYGAGQEEKRIGFCKAGENGTCKEDPTVDITGQTLEFNNEYDNLYRVKTLDDHIGSYSYNNITFKTLNNQYSYTFLVKDGVSAASSVDIIFDSATWDSDNSLIFVYAGNKELNLKFTKSGTINAWIVAPCAEVSIVGDSATSFIDFNGGIVSQTVEVENCNITYTAPQENVLALVGAMNPSSSFTMKWSALYE